MGGLGGGMITMDERFCGFHLNASGDGAGVATTLAFEAIG
jgi:hypothetical protein